ncbi:efflux RND transporter periplasmic adaptor subunit [Celerinatantimonas sp. YJH-8]|uniref:efflux RND transporter periplasmic adaptor subunit n=1 Tax=Celerinatantimonas sp. YJH-8 TaxID=3228714 RepID=UPI0038C1E1AE
MNIMNFSSYFGIVCLALTLSGCQHSETVQAPKQPEIGVYQLSAQNVLLHSELPGRTAAYQVAEVRPQVSGIIQKRLFTEGSVVQKGQQLYQIDPAIYEADVARAEANQLTSRNLARRYQGLLKAKAISQQQYDDAQAQWKQSEADLKTAQINLQYTKVLAPISGRIGRSSVTAGALVNANQATPLASINQLDPIYVDISEASTDLLRLRQELKSGQLTMAGDNQIKVNLLVGDHAAYNHSGTLKFSEVTVDPGTGSVILRAQFPNPERLLMPGMFVRAKIAEGIRKNTILLPEQALCRNFKGLPYVWVVGHDHIVSQRPITVSQTLGNTWIVESGLTSGESVVTEGIQFVKSGMKVNPVKAENIHITTSFSGE